MTSVLKLIEGGEGKEEKAANHNFSSNLKGRVVEISDKRGKVLEMFS